MESPPVGGEGRQVLMCLLLCLRRKRILCGVVGCRPCSAGSFMRLIFYTVCRGPRRGLVVLYTSGLVAVPHRSRCSTRSVFSLFYTPCSFRVFSRSPLQCVDVLHCRPGEGHATTRKNTQVSYHSHGSSGSGVECVHSCAPDRSSSDRDGVWVRGEVGCSCDERSPPKPNTFIPRTPYNLFPRTLNCYGDRIFGHVDKFWMVVWDSSVVLQ